MKQNILGVIGGLGPLATARFLELTTAMTDAKQEQDHLDMIIYNFPSIPDRTGYILGSNLRSPLPGLLSAAKGLSDQGVSCIAIPCVTAHYFNAELTSRIATPMINGVRETVQHLLAQGVRSAGILATDGTLRSELFTSELQRSGITPIIPGPEDQTGVMHLIYDQIKAGQEPNLPLFLDISDHLRRSGAEAIILGCTELSLLKRKQSLGSGFLDTMEVLAQQSILRCEKKLKPRFANLIT